MRVKALLDVAAVGAHINAQEQSAVSAVCSIPEKAVHRLLKPKAGLTLMSTR